MIQPKQPLYQHKVEKLDLEDFSSFDDPECISEDGLNLISRCVYKQAVGGWEVIECARDERNPFVLHMRFQKEWEL